MTDQMSRASALSAFGARLRQLRTTIGLSQEALADLAGLDRTYISACERGRRNPSLLILLRLGAALGVEAAHLLPDHGLGPQVEGEDLG